MTYNTDSQHSVSGAVLYQVSVQVQADNNAVPHRVHSTVNTVRLQAYQA